MAWPKTVRKSDLIIERFKGSGPGGQHRNKRETAVRITHKPTNIQATCQEHKESHKNLKECFQRLAKKLTPLMMAKEPEHKENLKQIRKYNFIRNEVTDKRIPNKKWDCEQIINGKELEILIKELCNE